MTFKGNIKALAAKSLKLKVRDVLQSEHSAKWIDAINLEVNSLVNNFKSLVPEEIDYRKDYDCIHATIDLKVKYVDETMIKARECVDVEMNWYEMQLTQMKLILPQ